MNPSFSLVTELERLAKALTSDGGASAKLSLQSVAERIAKLLGVKPDEVAIMGLSTRWKHLYFLAPEALLQVGYIPLSSNSALAARTARESRPEINNKFFHHLRLFFYRLIYFPLALCFCTYGPEAFDKHF